MPVKKIKINENGGQSIRTQIVQHAAKFSSASFIGGIGRFFNAYFATLLLGPTLWGAWQGTRLVLQYGGNLHLGVRNGMHRELPILKGKRESRQQAAITDVTFTFNFIAAIVVSLGILFSTFVITMGSELRLSLQFISAMVFLQYLNSFYGIHFRANNEFGIVSRVALINGLCSVFSISLVFLFGLSGFLGGHVLRLLITTAYCWWKSSYVIHWRWDNKVLRALILIGFPIMLMVFANVIFTTIDRLLILKFLDAKSLGFYSLGNLIFTPLLMIFTASGSVMYPRFAEKYGETGDPRSLRRYITLPMENLAAVIPILIGGIYIALPLLVKVFLPEYTYGVLAVRILIFGLFFYAMAGMAGNMLLTINKQVLRLWILLGSALLNFGFSYTALQLGYGIAGVAAGTSLAYFVFFLTSSVMAIRYTRATYKETGTLLLRVLGPIFYLGAVVVLLSVFLPMTSETTDGMILQTIVREVIFAGCGSYLLYKLIWKSQITTLLFRGDSL